MAAKKRKKRGKAAYKRTKKVAAMKRKLRRTLRTAGLTTIQLKKYDKMLEHGLRGILSEKDLKETRIYYK